MVMIPNNPSTRDLVDISFLYSLECDLHCSFCMYDCGPAKTEQVLSINAIWTFIQSIGAGIRKIHTFGLYGGEPAVNLRAYYKIASMLPVGPARFTITNGTWSKDVLKTCEVLDWSSRYNILVCVSSTPEHIPHQDREVLEDLAAGGRIILKDPDTDYIPMGRQACEGWSCKYRCHWDQRSRRLGVLPTGEVMMQSCDGVYPIIGHIREGFPELYRRVQSGEWERHCPRLASAHTVAAQHSDMYWIESKTDTK